MAKGNEMNKKKQSNNKTPGNPTDCSNKSTNYSNKTTDCTGSNKTQNKTTDKSINSEY